MCNATMVALLLAAVLAAGCEKKTTPDARAPVAAAANAVKPASAPTPASAATTTATAAERRKKNERSYFSRIRTLGFTADGAWVLMTPVYKTWEPLPRDQADLPIGSPKWMATVLNRKSTTEEGPTFAVPVASLLRAQFPCLTFSAKHLEAAMKANGALRFETPAALDAWRRANPLAPPAIPARARGDLTVDVAVNNTSKRKWRRGRFKFECLVEDADNPAERPTKGCLTKARVALRRSGTAGELGSLDLLEHARKKCRQGTVTTGDVEPSWSPDGETVVLVIETADHTADESEPAFILTALRASRDDGAETRSRRAPPR